MPFSTRCFTGRIGNDPRKGSAFNYDYTLRLEDGDLPQKLEEVFASAGIDLPAGIEQLAKNNNTIQQTTEEFYHNAAVEGNTTLQELIKTVGELYQDDIGTFGYSFPFDGK